MKKTLFLLALACSLPTAGHSQGFMKKLKQKVENAVGISESTDIAEDQAQADDNHDGNSNGNKPIQRPTPSDKLQKLRTATATWDEAVTPSKASSIEALLKELPPLPSVDEMANPNAAVLKNLYARLCNTDDPAEIEQIYTEADELAKRARREAAVTWRKYLAEQIELNRGLYPQSMSLQADLVKAGMIPACAEKRASLNIVTICANFLDQAYSEFPEPEFTPVCKENIMKFPKNERMMRAESGYATSVDGFLSGSVIWTIDEENGTEYIYENGKKREMDAKGRQAIKQQQQKREDYEPPYGTWTSQSGKWTATYSRDGALTLHDGSTFYPSALKKEGNRLIWVEVSGENVEKCIYKL